MSGALGEVRVDLTEMRNSMLAMQRAMESLVRIDEQQINQRQAIARAFDDIKDERRAREELAARVHALEIDAPSYRELRRWVIGGVITGVGCLLASMFALVFKIGIADPVDRHFRGPGISQSYKDAAP